MGFSRRLVILVRITAFLFSLMLTACKIGGGPGAPALGEEGDTITLTDITTTTPDAPAIAPATVCTVTTEAQSNPNLHRNHLSECTPLTYPTVPPIAGDHYGVWADFKTYSSPVPWGYLVHDLEHGAIVIAYRCESACPDLVAQLQHIVDTFPADPLCTSTDARSRMILVPDPTLDVPIAAAAWGFLYRATCFDDASLIAFANAHYGHGPEQLCSPGVDDSASGWCN